MIDGLICLVEAIVSVAITYTTMAVTNWFGKNVSYAAILSKVTGVLGIITN